MNTSSLYFELAAITLTLVLGITLLSVNLPGWGLITVAALLAALSFGLRCTPALATVASTDAASIRNRPTRKDRKG
ncbi:MAG: hypothetical protein OIF57_08055 [Marinobacterium sp.]|nr:hypothetical protein [Marinobacterium sp.]